MEEWDFIKKWETPAQAFSRNFFIIFKRIYVAEPLRMATSEDGIIYRVAERVQVLKHFLKMRFSIQGWTNLRQSRPRIHDSGHNIL